MNIALFAISYLLIGCLVVVYNARQFKRSLTGHESIPMLQLLESEERFHSYMVLIWWPLVLMFRAYRCLI